MANRALQKALLLLFTVSKDDTAQIEKCYKRNRTNSLGYQFAPCIYIGTVMCNISIYIYVCVWIDIDTARCAFMLFKDRHVDSKTDRLT